MCHLAIKVPLNNPHGGHIAQQNEPEVSFEERPNPWIALPVPPRPPVMFPALRHNGHARIFLWLQNLFLATISLVCAPVCLAERADRDKPLLLESDQVLIDDMQQTSTFIGRVQLTQGTMLIRGDKIEVVKHKDGFKQAKAYGNTASFRQKREGMEEYVEGSGERIEYDKRTGTVDFYVQARVKRELDEVRGDHITYSMKTETFQVSSSAGSMYTKPGRVRAVLQPKPKADASTPPTQNALPITPSKTLTSPE
jgi:lipopolysaccharide export system protein LptA